MHSRGTSSVQRHLLRERLEEILQVFLREGGGVGVVGYDGAG